jgi:ribonuclease BN (tRNA processing enzyme)
MKICFLGSGDACASGGRNQTCILVQDEKKTFLLDCGPASLAALKKSNFDVSQIDFIINTHLHGDHFGGIPFLLLDLNIFVRRERDLNIYGPPKIGKRIRELTEVLYHEYDLDNMTYKINFIEIFPNSSNNIEGLSVEALPMEHKAYSDCLGYRISNGNSSFAYTGDTAWTENIIDLSRGTDLFICECSLYEKVAKISHVSYKELIDNRERIETKRLVLTHLSPSMLSKMPAIAVETAYDGLLLEI